MLRYDLRNIQIHLDEGVLALVHPEASMQLHRKFLGQTCQIFNVIWPGQIHACYQRVTLQKKKKKKNPPHVSGFLSDLMQTVLTLEIMISMVAKIFCLNKFMGIDFERVYRVQVRLQNHQTRITSYIHVISHLRYYVWFFFKKKKIKLQLKLWAILLLHQSKGLVRKVQPVRVQIGNVWSEVQIFWPLTL